MISDSSEDWKVEESALPGADDYMLPWSKRCRYMYLGFSNRNI